MTHDGCQATREPPRFFSFKNIAFFLSSIHDNRNTFFEFFRNTFTNS